MPIIDIINTVFNNHVVTAIFAVIFIVIGLTLNYFGIKLFRFLIACTGFLISALAAYIILINIHLHSHNFGKNFDHVIGGGVLIAGVLGALISGWIWKWVLLGVGAFGGVSLTLIIFSGLNSSYFPIWLRPVAIGLSAIIGAFLIHTFERPVIIFSTAITGSLLYTYGLDAFIDTGFDFLILTILSGSVDPTKVEIKEKQVYGMILLWIGSTILGVAIQSRFVGKNIKSVTKE